MEGIIGSACGGGGRFWRILRGLFPVRGPALTLAATLILAAVLPALLGTCAGGGAVKGEGPGLRDGVWEGSGQGWGGEIRVRLRINSALIQEIEILPHQEDPFIGGEALGELLELVLDYQSTGLDAVSGATESSTGFLAAVEDALNRAGGAGN
jgi:fumarate reductase flavoprotein subunit